LNNTWEKEYEKLLEGQPKNVWIPWRRTYEISVVHTSEPHGMLSYGWDGPKKLVLWTRQSEDRLSKYEKQAREMMFDLAKTIAEELNKKGAKRIA